MRKWLLAFAVLCVLSLALLVGATVSLLGVQEQVTFTEEILLGDKGALEGLDIEYHAHIHSAFFWDSRHTFTTGQTQTDFAYDPNRTIPDTPYPYAGVQLSIMTHELLFSDSASLTEPWSALAKLYEDLEESTPPGEEKTLRFRLGDYVDYYPIGGYYHLPDGAMSFAPGFYGDADAAVAQAFSDFFRIPVLAEEEYEITCSKVVYGSNQVGTSGGGPIGPGGFGLEQISLPTEHTCYFTFNPRSQLGVPVDTSLIPGGYGIYAIDHDGKRLLPQTLRNAFPLDTAEHVMHMREDGQGNLLLFSAKDGDVRLRVLDMSSMVCLQQIPLASLGNEWYSKISVQKKDGALICSIADSVLAVLTRESDGSLLHRFTVPIAHNSLYHRSKAAYAYRDGKLAVAYIPDELNGVRNWAGNWCVFALAVYDETGLCFHANYASSLAYTELAYRADIDCDPWYTRFSDWLFRPMELHWN